MFTFTVSAVRAVIMRGRIDAFLNGGFRNPHYGLAPGKDEKPGVWLVGDEGVYVMSNGKLAEGSGRSSSMPRNAIRRPTPTTGTTSAGISGAMTASTSSTPRCS